MKKNIQYDTWAAGIHEIEEYRTPTGAISHADLLHGCQVLKSVEDKKPTGRRTDPRVMKWLDDIGHKAEDADIDFCAEMSAVSFRFSNDFKLIVLSDGVRIVTTKERAVALGYPMEPPSKLWQVWPF